MMGGKHGIRKGPEMENRGLWVEKSKSDYLDGTLGESSVEYSPLHLHPLQSFPQLTPAGAQLPL